MPRKKNNSPSARYARAYYEKKKAAGYKNFTTLVPAEALPVVRALVKKFLATLPGTGDPVAEAIEIRVDYAAARAAADGKGEPVSA